MTARAPGFMEIAFPPEGPQPLVRETLAGAAQPVHALGQLRAAVEAVPGMTQAPAALAAQSALGCIVATVQHPRPCRDPGTRMAAERL